MKLHIRSIILASFLSACSILFLSSNCAAALMPNNTLTGSLTDISKNTAVLSADTKEKLTPSLIQPQDAGQTFYKTYIHKKGSVVSQGGFLFYSNNPEYVNNSDLADNGCWLNRADVDGSGQVYLWHKNITNKIINSELSITNTNNKNIIINCNQYGLTNGPDVTDVNAWNSYLESDQTGISIIIKPGQSLRIFKQVVAPNNNFGLVAAINITDENGNPAKAILEDLAYYQNIWEVKYAASDGTERNRGVGASFQNIITFDTAKITSSNYFTYTIGAINDSLHGQDLVKIKDCQNGCESLLEGNYGQVMTINIPIKNYYKKDQNFGIFVGSIGGYAYPFVKLDEISFVSSPVKPFTAYDMIQTGKMSYKSSKTVSFTLVIPALSSTPLIIGVHPID